MELNSKLKGAHWVHIGRLGRIPSWGLALGRAPGLPSLPLRLDGDVLNGEP
jgi:hypothetical protein